MPRTTRPRPASPRRAGATPDALVRSSGQASGAHAGLHRPGDDGDFEDRLEDLDPAADGEQVFDHLRDRRGKGVAGAYDDSIDHAAGERYGQEPGAAPPGGVGTRNDPGQGGRGGAGRRLVPLLFRSPLRHECRVQH
ncbi:hypothetical protein [Cognatiluteimonas weifangensis]|uniref:hypothetical protein n=1 Tax=Cognatiluteimonas weifangensis TaxID=2303539 RepID=UPI0011C1372A|nr:hypothetical protein [Luteimonas weifangensis]